MMLDRLSPQVSKWDSLASAKSDACLLDAVQEFWMMFETILKPILFRRKSNEDAGSTTVPRDHNLLINREPQILGKVILYLRQSHFPGGLAYASLVRRATIELQPS